MWWIYLFWTDILLLERIFNTISKSWLQTLAKKSFLSASVVPPIHFFVPSMRLTTLFPIKSATSFSFALLSGCLFLQDLIYCLLLYGPCFIMYRGVHLAANGTLLSMKRKQNIEYWIILRFMPFYKNQKPRRFSHNIILPQTITNSLVKEFNKIKNIYIRKKLLTGQHFAFDDTFRLLPRFDVSN